VRTAAVQGEANHDGKERDGEERGAGGWASIDDASGLGEAARTNHQGNRSWAGGWAVFK
jgi:hypothetical protein